MFTGIIQAIGTITKTQPLGDGLRLTVNANQLALDNVKIGDSIAINGACMTIVSLNAPFFEVEVSAHSLQCTVGLDSCHAVNLEGALKVGDALGGHFVSGHVDSTAPITALTQRAESVELCILVPPQLSAFVAAKGSICIDGVSLTINRVTTTEDGAIISINLIPHTAENTTLLTHKVNERVNIEVDLLARYILGAQKHSPN